MDAVYIYEGGRYIETATEVERFNEATIEQTRRIGRSSTDSYSV